MRLTTRGRYAVTAMLDLAIHLDAGPVALSEIADRHGISQSYLEQLFARLRKEGLVDGLRGPHGGYKLGRPDHTISVADVIDAVHESIDATGCSGQQNCRGDRPCLTHDLWEDLSCEIRNYLSGLSLSELVKRKGQKHSLKKHRAAAINPT